MHNATDELFSLYGLNTDADVMKQPGNDLAGDLFLDYSTWKWGNMHKLTSGQPVYRYRYCHPRPDMELKDKVAGLAGGVQDKTSDTPTTPKNIGAVHSADIENNIKLDNLKPGTRYYYRVCAMEILYKGAHSNHFGADTLRTPFHSFRTPALKEEDFTCLVFNDLHEHGETLAHLKHLAKDIDYDFVIFNGDCLPEPRNREHAISMIHSLTDEVKTYSAFTWGNTRFLLLDMCS